MTVYKALKPKSRVSDCVSDLSKDSDNNMILFLFISIFYYYFGLKLMSTLSLICHFYIKSQINRCPGHLLRISKSYNYK